jgi:hypothetical protein
LEVSSFIHGRFRRVVWLKPPYGYGNATRIVLQIVFVVFGVNKDFENVAGISLSCYVVALEMLDAMLIR